MTKLKHLEHEVIVDKHHHYEAEAWCKEHFGKRWDIIDNREGRWTVFWTGTRGDYPNRYRWCFADERDAAWFALKWKRQ
jgi:hypothetical protein